jgi:DNA mismatch repair protein MutS
MTFHSILFEKLEVGAAETPQALAFFRDLNLVQVVDSITACWKEYSLEPFYYLPLADLEAIEYRQQVVVDLQNKTVMDAVRSFSCSMRSMRERTSQAKRLEYYKYSNERCFLGAISIYCKAVEQLSRALIDSTLSSRGFQKLRDFLAKYVASASFRNLASEAAGLEIELSAIRYNLFIREASVTVRDHEGENNYSTTIEQAFEKFRREASKDYWVELRRSSGMNHIEAQVLERVAALNPEVFQTLDSFCTANPSYLDETIARFDREVQFYVAYLTHIEKLKRAGLDFCLPQLSKSSKAEVVRNTFDLALADKLLAQKGTVVLNDYFLRHTERIFVVSGPNHGGKTTFARMFGQLHYLANLGCPVPGREARLFVCDRLFTHFERAENMANLRGKLQDDLVRIHEILEEATSNSVLIMNEVFSSTTVQDALSLSQKVMARISRLDVLAVWVTFLDELAAFDDKTVSVVAGVDTENPTIRTFKLARRAADGLAYAITVAEKHRVTYEHLMERIKV